MLGGRGMNLEALRQTLAVLWRKLRREAQERAQALRSWAAPEYDRVLRRTREGWAIARERVGPALTKSRAPLHVAWRRCATGCRSDVPAGGPAPTRRQACAGWSKLWHRGECWVAVAAFGFIAAILLLDVIGREFVGPVLRFVGLDPGATGIFAAQKLSVFALVIGSFAGIGIATATGSHIVPRFAYGWVPAAWGPCMDRLADVLTGLLPRRRRLVRLQVRRLLLQDRLAGAGARLAGLADPALHPARLPVGGGALLPLRRLAGAQAAAAGVPGR